MQEISDSLIVGFLHRPIGFRSIKSKEVTVHEVRKWIDETKPSPIKKISIGGVGAIVLTVIGSVTGFLGIRKDNSIGKWLGGIFTLIGVGAAINAIFGAPKLRTGGEKEV
ncbi:MAG: hypothetical protein HYZ79_03080, partial [Candidatus Melainabacteria bacterium]|nr:hypothetical protein [Candidatus Melainabacteria bacterium]